MERLNGVLRRRRDELVSLLVLQEGFDIATAMRFVVVAGEDLLQSYSWQAHDLRADDPTHHENIRRLLGLIHANAIAASVGIPKQQVWNGLRTLVPSVLRMASRRGAAHLRTA